MEKQKNAVGRRKEAVTRVFLSKGEGKITIGGAAAMTAVVGGAAQIGYTNSLALAIWQ